ncbi:hypothetical protein BDY21DRAFT_77539 [Lineolata rhizophorae]|uniref:Uncharacterized protein n=1 Tax=Lineolata rhizophorae TaxID=578093 RepID=A0A6A6NTG9_9PEZI|nr:hypothetical protein BDY21DRAFT_77539 [Lineolata rhizophorae]
MLTDAPSRPRRSRALPRIGQETRGRVGGERPGTEQQGANRLCRARRQRSRRKRKVAEKQKDRLRSGWVGSGWKNASSDALSRGLDIELRRYYIRAISHGLLLIGRRAAPRHTGPRDPRRALHAAVPAAPPSPGLYMHTYTFAPCPDIPAHALTAASLLL